ncbi:MAG TPA: glycoside hydrolase family 2 TIM barrel-domain containing protein [Puia sp.]|nr:glycoside hydrolase family 2 TIM barrel-domain containing protein [Puia sp.]
MKRLFILVAAVMLGTATWAQQTEKLFLSGTGSDHTVQWKFYCTAGRNSGRWTTIPVPSNWELQGFGKYNYGLDKDSVRGREEGLYKYRFEVPAGWKGKTVNIVFDGSMTDTKVLINGKPAGPIHQGSFYRFRYDISKLLHYGRANLLEATVSKVSANRSVNMAERHCDFWIFGGIYRPVWLEALPAQHISYQAIDAEADGRFTAMVRLSGSGRADRLEAQLYTLTGAKFGNAFSRPVHTGDTLVRLEAVFASPETWNPEAPHLYRVVYRLLAGATVVHEVSQRFGFRTVELRPRDGIYVNGVRIKFKGICRHSFWPTTGRALNKNISLLDVGLIKEMNMNAVRMSHYPPDDHFLDVCDSLGLFVLDELTGWHHYYDTEVGSKLVKEMVSKDVNHPSIVIWDNGNEGGFNFDLDPIFDSLDIQKRPVIHPWAVFRHTDTQHYINYDYGDGTHLHGHHIVFPTEFLHGLYDGGQGAGLGDFWEEMWREPLSAGGFLWDFSDGGVMRTDRDSALDTDGDHGPDGITGPYREKEGSFFAVKEVWSPVRIDRREITPAFDGRLQLENRYFYTNLRQCRFKWRLERLPMPGREGTGGDSGNAVAPDIAPGERGTLQLDMPAGWDRYDLLQLTAVDPHGKEIYTWAWPIHRPAEVARTIVDTAGPGAASWREDDTSYWVSAAGIQVQIGKRDGLLKRVRNGKGGIPFNDGPRLAAGTPDFQRLTVRQEGSKVVVQAEYAKKSVAEALTWTMFPSGWLEMDIRYFPTDYDFDLLGVNFAYPEKGSDSVSGIRWMGDGPYRVWKNRMQGVTLNVWDKAYNNTITGQSPCIYPEFKGYFSHFYWMTLKTAGQPVTVVNASEDVYLRLFTPAWPKKPYNTDPVFPSGSISFLQGIPPIGTKSQKPARLGPSGQQNMYYDYGRSNEYAKEIRLYFDFSGK